MSRADFTFKISRKVSVNADFVRKRAVISCKSKDGKSILLELDFPTLEKLHEQLEQQFESLWERV